MFWELIATFIAGIGAAGIVLSIKAVYKKVPKWLAPAAAGLGMIGFGVFNEYGWYRHTTSRLPAGTEVVVSYAEPVFYQPWSYYKAPIRKFVALDKHSIKDNGDTKQAQLYFMERRMMAQTLPVLVDCTTGNYQLGGGVWQNEGIGKQLQKIMCVG